jgi:hypothetical protein
MRILASGKQARLRRKTLAAWPFDPAYQGTAMLPSVLYRRKANSAGIHNLCCSIKGD